MKERGMRHEPTEEQTLALAKRLHAGQTDWQGRPFWTHLAAVRDLLGEDASEAERKAALLHDCIEDTPATAGFLRSLGYTDEVVEIVELLTRPAEENPHHDVVTYDDIDRGEEAYLRKVRGIVDTGNLSAMRVKLADNRHNADPARRVGLAPDKLAMAERLCRTYARSMAMLEEAILDLEEAPACGMR